MLVICALKNIVTGLLSHNISLIFCVSAVEHLNAVSSGFKLVYITATSVVCIRDLRSKMRMLLTALFCGHVIETSQQVNEFVLGLFTQVALFCCIKELSCCT